MDVLVVTFLAFEIEERFNPVQSFILARHIQLRIWTLGALRTGSAGRMTYRLTKEPSKKVQVQL
jgi:hypothetical protein